jgi:hypothetical protein
MPDYQQGKIYAVRSHLTTDIYIGATCNQLSVRMAQHRSAFKSNKLLCKSFKIIEKGDAYIELIEAFPCNNKDELNKKEGELIRASLHCVNCRIEDRTKEEYRETHKEQTKQHNKQYRETHQEEVKQYMKEYRKDNEELKKKKKDYYEKNKEKILQKQKEDYHRNK